MKGIMFRSEMIKAIIEGRKTQTRRLSGLQDINFVGLDGANEPTHPDQYSLMGFDGKVADFNRFAVCIGGINVGVVYHCKPRYQVGETVYIKEPIEVHDSLDGNHLQGYLLVYPDRMANMVWLNELPAGFTPKSFYQKMFMPAWAARYHLLITDVRAERLQEITEEDALAEGTQFATSLNGKRVQATWCERQSYKNIWDSINKPPYDWRSNPFVWVYSFKLLEAK